MPSMHIAVDDVALVLLQHNVVQDHTRFFCRQGKSSTSHPHCRRTLLLTGCASHEPGWGRVGGVVGVRGGGVVSQGHADEDKGATKTSENRDDVYNGIKGFPGQSVLLKHNERTPFFSK